MATPPRAPRLREAWPGPEDLYGTPYSQGRTPGGSDDKTPRVHWRDRNHEALTWAVAWREMNQGVQAWEETTRVALFLPERIPEAQRLEEPTQGRRALEEQTQEATG